MRLSTASFLSVVVVPIAVSAAPFRRSIDSGTLEVLQFANVLEQLETSFYSAALAKFQASDFTAAGFPSASIPVQELTAIQSDEATHVTTLQSLITSFGATPLTTCKFDFSNVLTSVSTMLPVARTVELVGVGAYLGAAVLIGDPSVLTAAGSIATIEARHQTILNVLSGATAIPQAFDIPLLPQEVLAIAGQFISGDCDVGITPNAPLALTNTGAITPGTLLEFSSPAFSNTDGLSCQMLVGGASLTLTFPLDQCIVPQGINGPVAIFVTSDDQPLDGDAVKRQNDANDVVLAGPVIAFVDSVSEALGQLVGVPNAALASSNNTAGASSPSNQTIPSTTQTIPPAQASTLPSSIASTPTPSSNPSSNSTSDNSANGSPVIANGVSLVPKPTSTS